MEFILTDKDLQGFNLISKKEAVTRQEHFSTEENLIRALDQAHASGIKKFLCVPQPKLLELLEKNRSRWSFEVFGMVPDFQQFVRDTSHYGTAGAAVRRILGMPHLKKLRLIKVALAHLPRALGMKFEVAMNLFLMAEAAGFKKPKALILHSQITDLALSLSQESLFKIFCDIAANELGAEPGIATINFVRLTEVLNKNQVKARWILAPFNPKGYQMNPTPDACHSALKATQAQVIAEHWTLGNSLPQDSALAYLKEHPFAAATKELSDF